MKQTNNALVGVDGTARCLRRAMTLVRPWPLPLAEDSPLVRPWPLPLAEDSLTQRLRRRTNHKIGSSKLISYSLQTRLIASLLPYYASITTRKLPRFFATRQAVVVPERSNSKSRMVGPTRKL